MRINNPTGQKGSFGIPPEMQEAAKRRDEAKERAAQPKEAREQTPEERKVVENWPLDQEAADPIPENIPTDESIKKDDPFELLKAVGIEATEEDFHDLIFRGYVEKEVPVQVNPLNKKEVLRAKIRLLTGEEYDLIDELLAEDLDVKKMTSQGLDARRSLWVMSFAVQELFGKPIHKPVMDKDDTSKIDLKETARAKRRVLSKVNSTVLNRMIFIHARMHMAFEQIQREANEDFLKKS